MNFYQSLGFLVFGSRLKRLSDTFLQDVNKVYKAHKIAFDASWFPVFYILSRKKEVSIREIADELGITHSAASQVVTGLQEKGLVKMAVSRKDARAKAISFTAKGEKLQQKIEPVWQALQQAMEQLACEGNKSKQVLQGLTEMETHLQEQSLFSRIETVLASQQA
ncbi:MarR family winged helix-turn-helix transcriptional regulator [Deminuibacter soli]|uniref:MarR family transcriptional regulator n=1 Tax=Deminuibacter soli TaxID=2291815 RepID=A0A3E1NJJ8_9BACT|nr:MarR family transcriptional regulator [Deminuibacter soli]RFM28051.1 MarR family transcriptional regulator [Deminuibacter soli]